MIGYISNNLMLPILDFFYGIANSYGFAIVALTLVIRLALYPLSAGSIRNMRRMRVAQPMMQKRVKEVQERYKNEPEKQREEMSKVYQEYGNPLAGCFPLLLQMPILIALFATLRGSPFANIDYTVDLDILPREQIERILPQTYATKEQNIYVKEGVHYSVAAVVPGGDRLAVGETRELQFRTEDGDRLADVLGRYTNISIKPQWQVSEGAELVRWHDDGQIEAIAPGKVKLTGTIPGIARNDGFLFIQELGRVGAVGEDGTVHWDILGMILFFGASVYVNQAISGGPAASANPQQQTVSKLTPIIFSGMFLFFPLPAGVLMYMTVANAFQTFQTFILMREPLPDNLQKIVEAQEKQEKVEKGREALPFEKRKKKEKASS